MPSITVQDALALPELQSIEILAGEKGINRLIQDVTVLEVPEPMYWLKGGELILTSFYGIQTDLQAQSNLIKETAPLVAGFCFNPGPGVTLSPDIIRTANDLSLPLLKMPGDMPYAKVITSVLQAILNKRAYQLSRSTEISSMLIKAILNGAEIKEIVRSLAQLVNNPVVFLDSSLSMVEKYTYNNEEIKLIDNGIPQLLSLEIFCKANLTCEYPAYTNININGKTLRVAIQAVTIQSTVYGYLIVWETRDKFDDIDVYAIIHASTAVALDSMRRTNIEEQRQKMLSNICEELLLGTFDSVDLIVKQGEVLDLNISLLDIVVVIQICKPNDIIIEDLNRDMFYGISDDLTSSLRNVVEKISPCCLASVRKNEIAIVFTTSSENNRKENLVNIVNDFVEICRKHFGQVLFNIGVGNSVSSIKELSDSYKQAKAAIDISRQLPDIESVIFYSDLGIYRLLHLIPDNIELRQYINMVLPNLNNCDQSLLDTLEVFIENQKSLIAAAKQLYIHPNTVKYRIQKAKEIWGPSILEDGRCIDTLITIKLSKMLKNRSN
jgi:sugar diacid utilization regulator